MSSLSYNAPPLIIGNMVVPGGLSINMDFGQTTQQTASDAYNFLNGIQANSTGFLGNMIDGTQHNVMTQAQSASSIMDFISKGNQAIMYQDATLRGQTENDSIGGNGGSYVCTVAHDYGEIDDEEFRLLNNFKNDFMHSSRSRLRLLNKYFLRAPKIVANLVASPLNREIFAFLKIKYISPILSHLRKNENKEALTKYCEMMADAEKAAKEL